VEQKTKREREKESEVIDASLLIEGERGTTTAIGIIEYPPALPGCTIIWPETADYATAINLAVRLRKNGSPIGSADIIIASMCLNRSLTLRTKDKDFLNVKEVEKSFKVKIIKN